MWHGEARFRPADVSRILGISDKTIHHHRLEFGLPVEQDAEFSDISHEELDSNVQQNIRSYMYTKF